VFVIAVVLQWPQIISVRGVGEGVGVGVGLAFARGIQSVAARQAQTTAATLCCAPRPVFAVRLLACIGVGIAAGIVRSRAVNPSLAHEQLTYGKIDTLVICRRVAPQVIRIVCLVTCPISAGL
jgi:F0F1-type ATP synthase membrane subunit c/vacuolar-type H+-ATPase subunit K